ncbi:MAG TPA: response regulator [Streptosporangiaceae bacterium]
MVSTVVIVDDDAGFRRMARQLLTVRGFRVVAEAGDAEAAIAAVRVHAPDCVLLDVYLPGRDGLALAQALREEPGAPRIVVASTDHAWEAEAHARGAAFVAKDRLFESDLHELFSSAGT